MYLLYSLVTLLALRGAVAVLRSTRRCVTTSTSAASGSASGTCRCRSISTATTRSGCTPCRWARCSPPARSSTSCGSAIPKLRLFLSTTTLAGQQLARRSVSDVDGGVLFSVRLDVHRAAHARPREAAPLRHDGDGDLAEPAARVPRPRREDDAGQRPHLVPLVPALPAGAAVLPARARRHRRVLRAGRGDPAAAHRARRRSVAHHGDRQPEVRRARRDARAGARTRTRARARAPLLPHSPRAGRCSWRAAR